MRASSHAARYTSMEHRLQHCAAPPGVQSGPNNSSKRAPNHASKTSTSASVTGTRSGQSSVTTQVERSCFAGRPANGQGSPSSASSCSDAVRDFSGDGGAIRPMSAKRLRRATTHGYARLRLEAAAADTWLVAPHGGASTASGRVTSGQDDPPVPFDALILLPFSFGTARAPTECPRVSYGKASAFRLNRGASFILPSHNGRFEAPCSVKRS